MPSTRPPAAVRPSASGRRPRRLRTAGTVLLLIAVACAAAAQPPYKVVGPDGRVTYTDRPPVTAAGRTEAPGRGTAGSDAAAADVALPYELRQAAGRYPVTLYVADADCAPCAAAREQLRRRGVPFSERRVLTPEDARLLERLTGSREAPTLAIGSQILRGLAEGRWDAYLDAAGYPRESQLPANYRYPPATPLTPATAAGAPVSTASGTTAPSGDAPSVLEPAPAPASAPAPGAAGRIRF